MSKDNDWPSCHLKRWNLPDCRHNLKTSWSTYLDEVILRWYELLTLDRIMLIQSSMSQSDWCPYAQGERDIYVKITLSTGHTRAATTTDHSNMSSRESLVALCNFILIAVTRIFWLPSTVIYKRTAPTQRRRVRIQHRKRIFCCSPQGPKSDSRGLAWSIDKEGDSGR